MLSSVLRSRPARSSSDVEIMRAFVRLRRLAGPSPSSAGRSTALERKYDAQFKEVFDAIRELMAPPAPGEKRRIGFRPDLARGPREPVEPSRP